MPLKSAIAQKRVGTTKKSVSQIIECLKAISTFMREHYLEREDAVRQLIFAVITRQHVLFSGDPGTAKSRMVKSFMSCFDNVRTFTKQLSKFLPEEAIIGSLNPKLLREQGVYEYNTDGTLVDAHLAYLDEVFDANDSTLRSTLEILNERIFTKGHVKKDCPLVSCFMASNFHRDDKNVEAFIDRIMFKNNLGSISEKKNKLTMITSFVQDDATPMYDGEKLTPEDLDTVWKAVRAVSLPNQLIEMMVGMCGEFSVMTRTRISDRKLNNLTFVLRAAALVRGEKTVSFDDFQHLRYGLLMIGGKQEDNDAFERILVQMRKFNVDLSGDLNKFRKDIDAILAVPKTAGGQKLNNTVQEIEKKLEAMSRLRTELFSSQGHEKDIKEVEELELKLETFLDQLLKVLNPGS